MKTPADKSTEPQRQAAAHEAPQLQDRSNAELMFVDNREETANLQKLQEKIDNSPRRQSMLQLKTMMNVSSRKDAMRSQTGMGDVPVQRVEDEEVLQGEFSAEPPVQLAQPPEVKPNNTGLPDNLKAGVESLSGLSLDNVKVHYNSSEPAQLNAHAYAQGTDIHLGPGQEQHLPHEAWHVVQQAQGRVKPTMQMKDGVGVNDEKRLEKEAYVMGAKALQIRSFSSPEISTLQSPPIHLSQSTDQVAQLAPNLTVKQIASGGSLYKGLSVVGAPDLNHNAGVGWYATKATANVYATAALWRFTARRDLNLIDMSTAASVRAAINETLRRRGVATVSPALQTVLNNHDFAYAVPNVVATNANAAMQYALNTLLAPTPWAGDNGTLTQTATDGAIATANMININDAPTIRMCVGSVIETYAGHASPNAVTLDNALFLATPANYTILRKDSTATDEAFANALLNDLNDTTLFHGLYVPAGMKFGGWGDTLQEILIRNSASNLRAVTPATTMAAADPAVNVQNAVIDVDNGYLRWCWRLLTG